MSIETIILLTKDVSGQSSTVLSYITLIHPVIYLCIKQHIKINEKKR